MAPRHASPPTRCSRQSFSCQPVCLNGSPTIQTLQVHANGLDFTVRELGEGPRLALLLHGFPDDADSMLPLAERLADAGYRCAAPFMRGYAPTSRPDDEDYHAATLGDDVGALITALGHDDALVVGHDWGAVATYAALASHPGRIRQAVAVSVPPARALLGNLRRDPLQLRRSAYMGRFQHPRAAESIRAGDMEEIDRLWRLWSPGWTLPDERLTAVKARLAQPEVLEAALGYYRALLPRQFRRWTRNQLLLRAPTAPPVVLAGRTDGCMGPQMYNGVQRLVWLPGGHFLPLEYPGLVAQEALRIDTARGGKAAGAG